MFFDATTMLAREFASLSLRDQPGWVTFSLFSNGKPWEAGDPFGLGRKQL